MPLDLDDLNRPRTRWIALEGHLAGVEILVRFYGTEATQKFRNRMESDGIIKVTRDNPLSVNPGREGAFFEALAARYVVDWREAEGHEGAIKPQGAPFDAKKMGAVLRAYPSAYELVMREVAKEDSFFPDEPQPSTQS